MVPDVDQTDDPGRELLVFGIEANPQVPATSGHSHHSVLQVAPQHERLSGKLGPWPICGLEIGS